MTSESCDIHGLSYLQSGQTGEGAPEPYPWGKSRHLSEPPQFIKINGGNNETPTTQGDGENDVATCVTAANVH